MLGIFSLFCRLLIIFLINGFKSSFDPDQVGHFVRPDPGPYYLQRLSAEDNGMPRFNRERQ